MDDFKKIKVSKFKNEEGQDISGILLRESWDERFVGFPRVKVFHAKKQRSLHIHMRISEQVRVNQGKESFGFHLSKMTYGCARV